MTSLGMPALPPPAEPTWKQAWDTALYGPGGYLRSHPATGSVPLADVLALLRPTLADHTAVTLLGTAGALAPDLSALGLEVRFDVPPGYDGLVLATDWLSHVPTHVVAVDSDSTPRLVHVTPATGREVLGARLTETSVPQSIGRWLERWWPVLDHGPGARAEVGTSRDAAWRGLVDRLGGSGRALAVEPGHLAAARPTTGSLSGPDGAVPDGARDLWAAVALDAVAEAGGGRVLTSGALTWVEGVSGA